MNDDPSHAAERRYLILERRGDDLVALVPLFSDLDADALARQFGEGTVAIELGRDCAALDGLAGNGMARKG